MASTTSGGLIKGSAQWTPEQLAWLRDRAKRLGLISVSAAARMVVQEAMAAESKDGKAA